MIEQRTGCRRQGDCLIAEIGDVGKWGALRVWVFVGVSQESAPSQSLALKREATIKAMSRMDKESLIRQTE